MTIRTASDSERNALETLLKRSRENRSEHLRILAGPAFTLLLLFAILWALLYWVGRKFFRVDIGLHSAAAPWLFGVGAIVLVLILCPEILKTIRRSKSAMSSVKADISSGMVDEMTVRIVDAMRLQEPEHGGFFYFLRTADDRVYVQYDYESQEFGVDGQDPESSKYLPRDTLNVIRTHHGGRVLASGFNGQPVPIVYKREMRLKPKHWPEPDAFCETPWNKLAATYAD